MKIYSCKYLRKFLAITIGPIGVFVRPDKMDDKIVLNHERIHWEQPTEIQVTDLTEEQQEWVKTHAEATNTDIIIPE